MAAIPDKVNPGDIITADLFNRVIALLNEHEALIGGAVPLRISSVTPTVLRVGEELKVFGGGLAASNLQEIAVESSNVSPAALKPGSSDGLMIFDVPALLVPPTGKTVSLMVRNKAGAIATGSFYVLPSIAATLEASFTITRTDISPGGAIAASRQYEFTYSIQAFSSMDETYVLDPKIIGAPTGWSVAMKGGATEILIAKSQPTPSTRPVIVLVNTGSAGGGTLSLGLRGKNFPSVTGSSQVETVAIDATPPAPVTDIEFGSPTVTGSVQKFTNGTLYIRTDSTTPSNQRAVINPLNVRLVRPGIYRIGTPAVSAGWSVTINNSPTFFDTTGTPNDTRGMLFTVRADLSAADGTVSIPLAGDGSLPDSSFTFNVKLRSDPSNPNPV